MDKQLKEWLKRFAVYLIEQWGLDSNFASDVALFYLYLHHYGLSPNITSGWRSPDKQNELLQRYLAGDPSVIYKPAKNSKHLNVNWLGKPASLAVDITCTNYNTAAEIARKLKIKPGLDFNDKVHFQAL